MEELKFECYYDDMADDVIERITPLLNKIGYDIDFDIDEFPEDDDAGTVHYVIKELV